MRQLLKYVLASLIMVIGSTPLVGAQAFQAALLSNENETIRIIEQQNGFSFDLIYSVEEETSVKVNILNNENRVVYTETVRGRSDFRRPYNLASLPSGTYTFEITGIRGTFTHEVQVR